MIEATNRFLELLKDMEVDITEFITLRIKGDILRELASHAYSKQIKRQKKLNIDRIIYTKEDYDYILGRLDHFITPIIFPKISKAFFESFERPFKIILLGILKYLNKKGELNKADLQEHMIKNKHISAYKFNKGIQVLTDKKLIEKPIYGKYKITKQGIIILAEKDKKLLELSKNKNLND